MNPAFQGDMEQIGGGVYGPEHEVGSGSGSAQPGQSFAVRQRLSVEDHQAAISLRQCLSQSFGRDHPGVGRHSSGA
jgi:hypothetical protein